MEVPSFERLNRPIMTDRLCNPLGQFVSVGLRSICLAKSLLVVH